MPRLAWVSLLCMSVLCASSARALDHTSPHLRLGLSAGLFGSLPIGDDVDPEIDNALWVHVEPLSVDLGDYVQLNAFFRLVVAGGYDTGPLRASIDRAEIESSSPSPREALLGISGRVFPFGATRIRPFLSFGTGIALQGVRFNVPAAEQGEGEGVAAARKQGFGGLSGANATYRHVGLGLTFGLGVRFDPTVGAFGEQWVLPILLEASYVKNVWLGLDRDPGDLWEGDLGGVTEGLGGKHMNVDFLGLLITFGFLR